MILEGSDLTLDKYMDIAHTYELGVPQAQAIGNQTSPGAAVDSLSYQNRGRGRGKQRITRQLRNQFMHQSRDQNMRQSRDQTQNCQYCGNKLHKNKTEMSSIREAVPQMFKVRSFCQTMQISV